MPCAVTGQTSRLRFALFQGAGNFFCKFHLRFFNLPTQKHLRDLLKLHGELPAISATLEMRSSFGSAGGREFAVEIRHELFWFNGMLAGGRYHGHASLSAGFVLASFSGRMVTTALRVFICDLALASASGRRLSLSARRARNRRERTVFTGIRNSWAISA